MRARPAVTVTFAQSLDGCLAAEPGRPLALSSPEALAYTHRLRASHAALLVGLGTVLADNPRLTVRHAAGPNPQPVILDSHLRCPPQAALLRHPTHRLWIAARADALLAPGAEGERRARRAAALTEAGAVIIPLPADAQGRVSLPALLDELSRRGLASLMVEGGAQVITAFLTQGLAERLIVTIAPRLLGGVHALAAPLDLALREPQYRVLGQDLIVEARVDGRRQTRDDESSSVVRRPSSI